MEQTAERFAAPTVILRSEMPSHCPVQSISWLVSQKSWDKERRFWLVSRMTMSRRRAMDRSYDKTGGAVLTASPVAYLLKNPRSMRVRNTP